LEEIEEGVSYMDNFCQRVEKQLQNGSDQISIPKTQSKMREHGDLLAKIANKLEKELGDE